MVEKIATSTPIAKDKFDAALGSVMGAFTGDAIGAFLEFSTLEINRKNVSRAFTLPGGGAHRVAPGQITDDSELAISLAHALSQCTKGKLECKKIVKWYGKWMESKPFDLGATTRNALIGASATSPNPAHVRRRALKTDSQSNGSLMRITPLAVFCSQIEDEKLFAEAIQNEVSLTHSNVVAQQAAICYCLAIKSLINSQGDRVLAYDLAKSWADKNGTPEFKEWFTLIESKETMRAKVKKGWVKIAFTYAFKYLRAGYNYNEAIEKMLLEGGDTDTNACIVGGLIGAAVGFSNIPETLWGPVMTCDTKKGANPRPDFLIPKASKLSEMIKTIFEKADTKMTIVDGIEQESAKLEIAKLIKK